MLFGKKKEKEQRSVLEEEQMQSPFRTIIKNLLENKLAMGGLIVFVSIFAMCFILPIWFHQDLNYQDPTQKNIAPGFSFLSVPSDLKDNAEVIEFGPTYGVGVDKDGYVYEWGQLTKNLKKIPADMGKVVDIAVGQDHVLAINDKGNLYTWGFNRMGLKLYLGKDIDIVGLDILHTVTIHRRPFLYVRSGERWANPYRRRSSSELLPRRLAPWRAQ